MLENGLPTRDANLHLLRDLLGVDVIVKPGKLPPQPLALAEFITDDNRQWVVCGVDLTLAAYMSAALSQVPKAVADEMIKAKKLEPNHLDNVREVLNIVSSLFNVEKMPHVRLREMALSGTPKYAELQAFVGQHPAQTHHEITVGRYGSGTMFFATAFKA